MARRQQLRLSRGHGLWEKNGIDYIFAVAGTKPLAWKLEEATEQFRTERAREGKPVVQNYTELRHASGSWHRESRVIARVEQER